MDHQHKPNGAGEDAPPIAYDYDNSIRGLIGVFDGLGGAGGETVEFDGGPARTNAWLASRRAAGIVLEVYRQLAGQMPTAESAPSSGDSCGQEIELPENRLPADFTEVLQRALQQRLARYAADIGAGGSGLLKSKLIKTLPTTMAICTFDLSIHEYTAIWAGDSRIYCLNPSIDVGLQQVTKDHLKTNPDAMQNLTGDAIMSNCVSVSADFVLEERRLPLPSPCVLIAATDGCFGYVHTPLQFEYMLLSSMREAQSFPDWGERLKAAIIQVTGDDATLAAFAIGWPDFATCREDFADRFEWCAKRVIDLDKKRDLADRLEKEFGRARDELTTLTQEQWEEYRRAYEYPTFLHSRVVPKPQGGDPSAKSRPVREGTGDDGEES
jgi:serine/threonine protein phosphatase PrpC